MRNTTFLHPIQLQILKKLLFKPKAKYAELNVTKITSDHFNFHIQKLQKDGLIIKNDSGLYELTSQGKEFANRFGEGATHAKQAKIGILIGCVKKNKREVEYLIQKRLKQPFFGIHGFMSSKILEGSTVEKTAEKALLKEAGLTAKLKIVGVMHKMDYDVNADLLEDKFFFIVKGTSVKGALIDKSTNHENTWMSRKQFLRLPKKSRFESTPNTMKILDKESFQFFEKQYIVETF